MSAKKQQKQVAQPTVANPDARKSSGVLLAVFLFALTIRAIYLWQLHPAPFFDLRLGDGNAYHDWARRIAGGHWLGEGVFYQAPLYPYFLAVIYKLFGDTTLAVRIAQAVTSAASCSLLASAGMSLFERRGAIAGVLLAIYPPALFLESLIEKSALITLFTTALLALLATAPQRMNRQRWIVTGVVLGLLALTRENALILTAPILLWICFGPFSTPLRKRLQPALYFAAGCGLILVPVGLRNLIVGGEFHLTTSQFGPNFYIGNHAGADGTYQPLIPGHGNVDSERDDATRLAEQAEGRRLSPSEVSAFWLKQAFRFITSQPGAWIGLTARKLAITFNAAERADTESQDVHAEWAWLLRILRWFDFGVVLALAAMGAVLTCESRRRMWFLYAIAAIYAGSTALFFIFGRYRFPLVPVLLLIGVGGLLRLLDHLKERRWSRQIGVALAAAACGVIVAHLPVVDTSSDRAVNYVAIAAALSKHPERFDQASEFYHRTLAEYPHWPPARYGMGLLLTQAGRHAEAIPHLRTALAVWPDYAEAHYSLAVALEGIGRSEEAAREYSEAMRARISPGR